jgi:hypothetical protein
MACRRNRRSTRFGIGMKLLIDMLLFRMYFAHWQWRAGTEMGMARAGRFICQQKSRRCWKALIE